MESPMATGLRSRSTGLKPMETKRISGIEDYDMVNVEDETLSPTSRLFHDPRFDVHSVAIMAFKNRIPVQPVKDKLVNTMLKHPRFTSLMVMNETNLADMKWVQTKVDLDQHIIIPEVDETQLESPDKFVEDYLYNLSKTSLDRSKPLWDIHIINVKTRDAESTALYRVHHSLGDGTSLISLLLACTRQTADELKLPTIPTKKRRSTPSEKAGLYKLLGIFWLFIVMLMNTVVDIFMFIITIIFLKDMKTPISPLPDSESSKARRVVHRIISLDDLKFVKNSMNVTINDVALGLTQAGLSKYLNRRYVVGGKDKGATERNNNLPKGIRLRSCLLFNLRSSAGIEDLTDMMENGSKRKCGWGNLIGYALLPFKIALRDDPLEYVKDAKATADRKKRSFEALLTMTMSKLLVKVCGIKVAATVTLKALSNSTVCFTNLVGPQEEIGICGKPITYIAPCSYGQPYALMIHFQSYIDKMIMVVSVDENVIPDPRQLLDDFKDSFNLIRMLSSKTSND